MVPEDEVVKFFEHIDKLIVRCKLHPSLLFNTDETFIDADAPRKVVCYCPYGEEVRGYVESGKMPFHLTMLACIAADKTSLNPHIILDLQTVPPSLLHYMDSISISGSKKGWINTEIWRDWVKTIFIPEVKRRREKIGRPKARALLISDGHNSREDVDTIRLLMNNNIDLLILPAHSSHILQPLDKTCFSVFKSKICTEDLFEDGDTKQDKREKLIKKAVDAWEAASIRSTIESAFAATGIWPVNSKKILNPSMASIVKREVEKPTPIDGPRINISNRVVTRESFVQELEAAKSKAHKPPPAKIPKTN